MEQTAKQDQNIDSPPKEYTAVPRRWSSMRDEEKLQWAEDFLVGSDLFPTQSKK